MSLSLYRKYRSQTFDELVGQEPVVKTLKNAIATGRIGHAYLFTGPRGVGKTSAARLLARAANCLAEGPDRPCNECGNCIAAGREIATDLIEIDAASNTGVDNIREIIERAQFSPAVWNTKFYIVDEVHMLSVSAFNALLKTLEEPPPQVAFILATTEVHKVPATVASRCQRFDFRRVPLKSMVDRLRWVCDQESIEVEDAALELVARQSTGSLRDALSLLDQLRVFAEGGIRLAEVQDMLGASGAERVADFIDCLVSADLSAGLRLVNAVLDEGLDVRQFNRQTVEHLRQLMLVKSGAAQASDGSLLDVTEEMKKRMDGQAAKVTLPDLLRWTKVFAAADGELRSTAYRQLPLEMALVEAILPPVPSAGQLRDHSAELAAGVEQVGLAPPERARLAQPASTQPPHQRQGQAARTAGGPMPQSSAPPPPIHEYLNGGAQASREEVGAEEKEVTAEVEQVEPVIASNGHVSAEAQQAAMVGAADEDEGDDLGKLKRLWPNVIDQINARSKQMAAVFRDPTQVRPYGVAGKMVTISFRYPIHAQRARGEQQRSLLENVLSRVMDRPCLLEAITFDQEGHAPSDTGGSNGPKPGPRNPNDKPPAPHETPRGRAVMNTFGIEKFETSEEG
jgi:DNA polymerase-3 subunit gamma/tau